MIGDWYGGLGIRIEDLDGVLRLGLVIWDWGVGLGIGIGG